MVRLGFPGELDEGQRGGNESYAILCNPAGQSTMWIVSEKEFVIGSTGGS